MWLIVGWEKIFWVGGWKKGTIGRTGEADTDSPPNDEEGGGA